MEVKADMQTKIRLLQLDMKQADLLKLLSERGIVTDAPELSRAINGCQQERYRKIMAVVNEILTEMEEKK